MTLQQIDLRIADDGWNSLEQPEALAQQAIEAGRSELAEPRDGEIAILLASDAEMQRLNADWRGKDKATDILSFPADARDGSFLGDLALGFGVCSGDARRLGLSLEDHVTHLLIHGYFHLLGFDHETDEEAGEMEAMEVSALARLGLGDPYSGNP